jgi:hypothetical protein
VQEGDGAVVPGAFAVQCRFGAVGLLAQRADRVAGGVQPCGGGGERGGMLPGVVLTGGCGIAAGGLGCGERGVAFPLRACGFLAGGVQGGQVMVACGGLFFERADRFAGCGACLSSVRFGGVPGGCLRGGLGAGLLDPAAAPARTASICAQAAWGSAAAASCSPMAATWSSAAVSCPASRVIAASASSRIAAARPIAAVTGRSWPGCPASCSRRRNAVIAVCRTGVIVPSPRSSGTSCSQYPGRGPGAAWSLARARFGHPGYRHAPPAASPAGASVAVVIAAVLSRAR